MLKELEILKGIHPGFVLERKIAEKKLVKGKLALDCREYPQTISSITRGKRDMNTALALKLEKALGLEEGYFMILQVYYDIKKARQKQLFQKPDLKQIRKIIFWDTAIEDLNWQQQYKFIIQRIFERGNQKEKTLITRFYGKNTIDEVLSEKSVKQKTKH